MRRALGLLVLSSLVLALGACKGRGQLVLGFATNLPARGQIDQVLMAVTRQGDTTPILSHEWSLSGVEAVNYHLPGSFDLYADAGASPVFLVDVQGLLDGQVVVDRKSSLGILDGEELFIRLGLTASCEQIGCPSSLTCVEGACQATSIDLRRLPTYESRLVNELGCDSGTKFIDTSTHLPMPTSGSCDGDQVCVEGTCLLSPSAVPPSDPQPFVGGASELFSANKAPGAFFQVGELDAQRYGAAAVELADGTVLVTGGWDAPALDGSGTLVSGAVVYDPATSAYRRLSAPPVTLAGHTATRLPSGQVLLVGTSAGKLVSIIYNPATQAFALSAAQPSGTLAAPRYFHTASLFTNGKVLIVGGASDPSQQPPALASGALLYDSSTGAWSAAGQGNGSSAAPMVVFHQTVVPTTGAFTGQALIIGGLSASGVLPDQAAVTNYIPALDEFDSTGFVSSYGNQGAGRALHTATLLSDGVSILIAGGITRLGAPPEASAVVMPANLAAAPTVLPAPPFARVAMTAVALSGGRAILDGGSDALTSGPLTPSAGGGFVFDLGTASWTAVPSLTRVLSYGVSLASGDALFGGGINGSTPPVEDGGLGDDLANLGEPVDLAEGADLSVPCNPLQAGMCGSGRRCAVLASVAYGPRVPGALSTACVADGTAAEGASCSPGNATQPDSCKAGLLCVPSAASGAYACQRLCSSDADCGANDLGYQQACGLTIAGLAAQHEGLCYLDCNSAPGLCVDGNGTNCRNVLHYEPAGDELDGYGLCLAPGSVQLGNPCNEASQASECSDGQNCAQGVCQSDCTAQADCDDGPGGTCTLLPGTFAQPDGEIHGYCDVSGGGGPE